MATVTNWIDHLSAKEVAGAIYPGVGTEGLLVLLAPYFAFGHASLAILCGVLFKLFSDLFSFIKKRAHISMRPQFLFN